MAAPEVLDTHHKALSINLEASILGSFAEIGAGQEVARWFLKVGAASGTVAKTICAYDKEISDHIYGTGSRYVSQQRLQAMLEIEWKQLLAQLGAARGAKTRFFSFVDTIAARNFAGTNLAHGWVGLRFQDEPGGPPNEVILHINLKDPANLLQQDAVGILGVNLLYAVHHQRSSVDGFLQGMCESVAPERLEIDYMELKGPAFGEPNSGEWDRCALHARLVSYGYGQAVVFSDVNNFLPATEALHKRAVVLAPGTFPHLEFYHVQMMSTAVAELEKEMGKQEGSVLGLFCISTQPSGQDQPSSTIPHIVQQIHDLKTLGNGVLLIRDQELYRMSAYVQRFTNLPIRFVVGISILVRVFQHRYETLPGSTLEGVSRLFAQNVRVYAYPMPRPALEEWVAEVGAGDCEWADVEGVVSADQLRMAPPLGHLYQYLLASNVIVPVRPGAAKEVSSSVTGSDGLSAKL